MVNQEKMFFLQTQFIPLVKTIDSTTVPRWGKMNAQQMVEHVSSFFKISNDKLHIQLVTPLEQLPKFREFLLSEKEFRENTKAPVLPEEPLPVRFKTMNDALNDLEKEVNYFFIFFADDPHKKTMHPVFGELNFEEWVQLHHKHVKHHLKQFGVEIPEVKISL
jgi:oxepin-CoA hydrolase/3-oxo-5,6-dehydrosuberyl-CoA semialdehyde dehydrogenase